MTHKISFVLDAIDNPRAPKYLRIISACIWALVLIGFAYSCLFFAFLFQ